MVMGGLKAGQSEVVGLKVGFWWSMGQIVSKGRKGRGPAAKVGACAGSEEWQDG